MNHRAADGLWKHAGRKRADKDLIMKGKKLVKGQTYFNGLTAHEKNEKVIISCLEDPIVRQIVQLATAKRRKKWQQFSIVFLLLSLGRPMTDFEAMKSLMLHLKVPDTPKSHWSDNASWEMANSLCAIVKQKTTQIASAAQFFSMSADEVTTIDNQSWMSVHLHVVVDWQRFPVLLSLQKLSNGSTSEAITNVVVDSIMGDVGGVSAADLCQKLVSFGADGAAVFQGCKTEVIARLQSLHAPFMNGMHYCAHRTNLAVEKLDSLPLVKKIETLCQNFPQNLHSYFAHSPKRQLEFQRLAKELETEGKKIQKNVKTRWISLLGPMTSVLREYRTLVAQMSKDGLDRDGAAARKNAGLLLDLECFLALPCVVPMLRSQDDLIRMSQSRDIFISDFLGAMKLCQTKLYQYYVDASTQYESSQFSEFLDIVYGHSHTTMSGFLI